MPKSTRFYDVLGVQPGVDGDEIKKAFWKKAKSCHPDHHPDNPEKEAEFKQLSIAYTILSDPAARRQYDHTGDESPRKDDEMVQAYSIIIRTFQQVRSEQGENIFYVDLFALIRKSLGERIFVASGHAKKLRKHTRMIVKLMKKIKHTAGEQQSFLHAALANERRDAQLAMCEARRDIRVCKKAEQMLDAFHFEKEERAFTGNYDTWNPLRMHLS